MAVQVGSLFVSMNVDTQPLAQGWARAQSITTGATGNIARQAGVAERSVQGFSNSLSGFRPYSLIAVSRAFDNAADRAGLLRGSLLAASAVVGGFAAALTSNLILRYADSYTNLSNQIRVVSRDTSDVQARFASLAQVADNSRSSLEATALLYSRIQKAAPTKAPEDILRFVETIQKALALGGATAQEARSAAIQLSQAIASNRLGGEELRAVLETPLGLALAEGLGITIGRLREMAQAGKITSAEIFDGLTKIEGKINTQFANSIKTVDQALVQFDNKLVSYFGSVNNAYGATRLLVSGIDKLSNNLDTLIPALTTIAVLVSATFAGRKAALFGAGISGLAGAIGGGIIGNMLGGASGAGIGALLGGLAGFRLPNTFKEFSEGAKKAKDEVINLRDAQGLLRSETLKAGMIRQTAIAATRGDTTNLATRSVMSEYERALHRELDLHTKNNNLLIEQSLSQQRLTAATARQPQIVAELNRLYGSGRASDQARFRALQNESLQIAKSVQEEKKALIERGVAIQQNSVLTQQAAQQTKAASGAVVQSGQERARENVKATSAAYREYSNSLGAIGPQLAAAEAATTRLGQAKAFLSRQVSAITGLFGGPWGVAITGAITLISLLAAKTQAAAQRQELYRKAFEELSPDKLTKEDFHRAQSFKLAEMEKQFSSIKDAAKLLAEDLRDLEPPTGSGLGAFASEATKEFNSLKAEIEANGGSVRGLEGRMAALAAINPGWKEKTNELLLHGQAMLGNVMKADALHDAIKRLKEEGFGDELKLDFDTDAIAKLGQAMLIAQLKAKGLTAEAHALNHAFEIWNKKKDADFSEILGIQKRTDAFNEQAKAVEKAKNEAKAFTEKMARLKEEVQGAFLGDLDRQVLEHARQMKATAMELAAYVEAAKTGDFSRVSPRIMELRDLELLKAAGNAYREVVTQYGNWAQITPMAVSQQHILNAAVAAGAINADQAKVAFGDFLLKFREYSWVTDVTNAFGEFAKSAILDFRNITQAVESLKRRMLEIALEIAVIRPFRDWATGAFGSFMASSLGASAGTSGVGAGVVSGAGQLHGGGRVGDAVRMRMVSGSFAGAPRLHSGLSGKEYKAILERGEHVLTARMASRTAGAIGGLSAAAESGGGGGSNVVVHNYSGQPGTTRRSRGPDGREMVEVIVGEALASGRMDAPMTRFGAQPVQARR